MQERCTKRNKEIKNKNTPGKNRQNRRKPLPFNPTNLYSPSLFTVPSVAKGKLLVNNADV